MPSFAIAIGAAFVASLAGLAFGVLGWRRRTGKIVLFASAFVLLLFATAVMLVLMTVGSGSMG